MRVFLSVLSFLVKIALAEPTPLKLGQRVDVEITSPDPATH